MKDFSFVGAKEALWSGDGIPIVIMAEELGTTEETVEKLIQYGYLHIVRDHKLRQLRLVGRPKMAGMTWLRQAMGPLPMVPIVPLKYAAEMLDMKERPLRKMILEHNIVLYIDPLLGEMMTIASFHRLFNVIYPWHERTRFDRQMFLNILCGIDSGSAEKFVRPLPYDQKLEQELRRISLLPQPERTLRAMEVYEAFRDAKKISDVVKVAKKTPLQSRVERMMKGLKQKIEKDNQD